jgi:hypothetical protein
MASSSTPASRLKKLVKELPDKQEVLNALMTLQVEDTHTSDRTTAIVGASFLERALETAIVTKFVHYLGNEERLDLFDGDRGAPLGSFSARIRIAYALGVYGPKTRDHLNSIRAIRNAFAHSPRVLTFDTAQVREVADQLALYKGHRLDGPGPMRTPKERFIAHVVWIYANLELGTVRYYRELQEALRHSREPDLA